MHTYRCTNPDCTELDVDKTSNQLHDEVICGTCSQPTTLVEEPTTTKRKTRAKG